MKKVAIGAASVIGAVAAAVLGLFLFLDVNQFRPLLEKALADALGRKVTVGNIKVALLSGGISLQDLTIADDPAFSREPFVTARVVSAGIDLTPLVLSRSLHVRSFRLEEPRVALRRSAAGVWNVSSLGASASPAGDGAATTMSLLVQRIEIAGGEVVMAGAGKGPSSTYSDVNLELSNVSFSSPFAFAARAMLPGGGAARLGGEAGPFNARDVAATPFQGTVDVTRLDIASTGFVDAGAGLKGVIALAGTIVSDGTLFSSKGKVTASRFQLLPDGKPARVDAVVNYDVTFNAQGQRGVIKRGDVRLAGAAARLTGDYSTKGAIPRVRLRLAGEKMPIADLEAALPAIGATLPAGTSIRQGTMDATLAIEGPLDRLVVSGPMVISNGTLANFDLGGRLGAIASFAGLPKGRDTILETLGAHLKVSPEGIAVDGLSMVVPTIGALTGTGTVAPNDALDFHMVAKLASGPAVPFRVTGTSSNPSFGPDLGAIGRTAKTQLAEAAKNPDLQKKAVQALGDLFRRRRSTSEDE